jgi:hypothetical protein
VSGRTRSRNWGRTLWSSDVKRAAERARSSGANLKPFSSANWLDPHSKRFIKVHECAVHVEEHKPLHGAIL